METQSLTTEVYFKVVNWLLKPENKIFAYPELPPGHCDQFGIKYTVTDLKLDYSESNINNSISFKSNPPLKDYALAM